MPKDFSSHTEALLVAVQQLDENVREFGEPTDSCLVDDVDSKLTELFRALGDYDKPASASGKATEVLQELLKSMDDLIVVHESSKREDTVKFQELTWGQSQELFEVWGKAEKYLKEVT